MSLKNEKLVAFFLREKLDSQMGTRFFM